MAIEWKIMFHCKIHLRVEDKSRRAHNVVCVSLIHNCDTQSLTWQQLSQATQQDMPALFTFCTLQPVHYWFYNKICFQSVSDKMKNDQIKQKQIQTL